MSNDTHHFEERISTALSRLSAALDALSVRRPAVPEAGVAVTPPDAGDGPDAAALASAKAALTQQIAENADLTTRLAEAEGRALSDRAALDEQLAGARAQLDAQGLEMQRLRMGNVQLRETLRALRDAAGAGVADAHQINKAMQAELDALRTSRLAEISELNEILAELDPLIEAARPAQESHDA
jgi:hypothetical protein